MLLKSNTVCLGFSPLFVSSYLHKMFLKYLLYISNFLSIVSDIPCKYFLKYIKEVLSNTGDQGMLIRQDFHPQPQLPPRLYMEQIMDGLSKAYCFLWDHKNEQNLFKMTWKELSVYYNKNAFRSNLRKLNNEGLLSYEESEDGISIELMGWDEMAAEL